MHLCYSNKKNGDNFFFLCEIKMCLCQSQRFDKESSRVLTWFANRPDPLPAIILKALTLEFKNREKQKEECMKEVER